MNPIPKHVGIIMDGNRRWAKKRGMPGFYGHREGALRTREIVREAWKLGFESLSLYAFSTENFNRPGKEVDMLMGLLKKSIGEYLDELVENNVRLHVMGDLNRLPDELRKQINSAIQATEFNEGLHLNIGLNYGGREEILRGVRYFAEKAAKGLLDPKEITEAEFASSLYTENQQDPDLIIRTGGEQRLSNFMLYQAAYSEFYFTEKLWPDFHPEDLRTAVSEFQRRERRFGGNV